MNIGKYTGAKMDAPDAKLRKYRFPGDTSDVLKKLGIRAEPGRESRHFRGITSGSGRFLEIEDRIFTKRYLRLYGSSLIIAYAVVVPLTRGLHRSTRVFHPARL